MAGGRDHDARKLTHLVLFVARQCEPDATFGSVKLNKILFFSDFDAFSGLGTSITGARYQHLPEGPALAAMVPLVRDIQSAGLAREIAGTEGPKHRRLVALADADVDLFSPHELAIVTHWITTFWGMSARDVSDFAHETVAWRITHDRQEIPYGTALISTDEPCPLNRSVVELGGGLSLGVQRSSLRLAAMRPRRATGPAVSATPASLLAKQRPVSTSRPGRYGCGG